MQATEQNIHYLLELRKLTMVEHLEQSGFFLSESEHLARLLDKFECSYLVQHNSLIIGAVKLNELADSVEIMQIQIHPQFQNGGFGKKVIEQIISGAEEKEVKLSVLKDNPALRLYQRLGFEIVDTDAYEHHLKFRQ